VLKYIINKELRENIATPKMMITSVIIILVMGINGLVFNAGYNAKQEKTNRESNENSMALRDKAGSLFDLLHYQQAILLPPSKLAFIAMGKEDVLPNGVKFNYFKVNETEFFKSQNNYFSSFRSLDWTFLLIYIVSFICLAFSYDTFSGEKSKGTLKLILSNNISRGTLILGKLTGLHICISVPLILGMLINLTIIQINANISFTISDFLFIFSYMLMALLFVALNLLLGFLVSSLTFKPAHTLNLLLIIWILFAIIIPGVSWLYARHKIKIPSEKEINEQFTLDVDELYKKGKYSWNWNSSWAGQAPNETVKSRAAGIQATDNRRIQLYREYLDTKFKQTDLAVNMSKISPFSLFRFIGERFSGNGYFGVKRFINQTRIYRRTLNDFYTQKESQDPDSYHLIWSEVWAAATFFSHKKVSYNEIPRFKFKPPEYSEIFQENLVDLVILVLWCILLFAGTFTAFTRYDIR